MCKIFLSSISFNCIFCCSILKIFPRTIFKFPRHSKGLQFYNAGKNIYLLTIKIKGKQKDFFFYCVLFLCFLGGAVVKDLHANEETCQWARDAFSIPGSRRSPEGGNGNLLQYSFFFFFCSQISIFIYLFFFTLQYCIGFAIHQQIRHGCNVFPILNPPPTSLRIPSLWGIPVHQPQASCILYFCLENCMDRGARWCTVRVVTESQRRLSDWMRARAHTHTHTHTIFLFL